jgi:beta-galactosidase/beta-glucuronidase
MTPARHGYPRPQLRRADWTPLNGRWDFAIDHDARWLEPAAITWGGAIEVPFAPETPASGVGETGYFAACWYRREIQAPTWQPGERLILHFGAVDFAATVWVNDQLATRHSGGYTPFSADVTALVAPGQAFTVVVRAGDDPHDLAKPRGKQDWLPEPHGIWYPRTTGIWQTVWLERQPATAIAALRWTPDVPGWRIGLRATLEGQARDDLRLRVRLSVGEMLLADDSYAVVRGEVNRQIALSDPGIDDARSRLLWDPRHPTIIAASIQLVGPDGSVIDEVSSYTALRQVAIEGDRFLLNGRPLPLRLVLDQGYWPESGITAPDDAALRRDVELAQQMGFNGVRKHQKIEDPRYLYWADMLGLLVWEEMPSAYSFSDAAVRRLTSEWVAAIERDISHPCIIAWVPFNESWGVPDLPTSSQHQQYVRALYHLTKTLDPSRPVIGNDGWEHVATDIVAIHDYDDQPERIARRYGVSDPLNDLLLRERLGGRSPILDASVYTGQPIMLTEFGGIAYGGEDPKSWGYTVRASAEEFAEAYGKLLETVRAQRIFAGFCYTQFADTYQETNGLLFPDRRPKFPLEAMAAATRGPLTQRQLEIEAERRRRLRALLGDTPTSDGDPDPSQA